MAKMLNSVCIGARVPKMFETGDGMIINGQACDKSTLEPKKLQTIVCSTDNSWISLNSTSKIGSASYHNGYYSDNSVVMDKYDPTISYSMVNDDGYIRVLKIKTENDKAELITSYSISAGAYHVISILSQDMDYLYGILGYSHSQYLIRIAKSDCKYVTNTICSYGCVTLMNDQTQYMYFAAHWGHDRFGIIKYDKFTNSITTIYTDHGNLDRSVYVSSRPIKVNDTEVVVLRDRANLETGSINSFCMKKYIIDYATDKVYSRNITFDCSMLPKGMILTSDDSRHWCETKAFKAGDSSYFSIYRRKENVLYLVKQITDTNYSVIQQYDLPLNYNGYIPYDNGKTLIFYSDRFINTMSFSEYEERFESTSSMSGSFNIIGIDKNKTIWLQNTDLSVEIVGINLPSEVEVNFIEEEVEYQNEEILTYIEVYCKNFNGKLVQADVELILSGPAKFDVSGSKKKKVRTSQNNVLRIPVTITDSGYVEVSSSIL